MGVSFVSSLSVSPPLLRCRRTNPSPRKRRPQAPGHEHCPPPQPKQPGAAVPWPPPLRGAVGSPRTCWWSRCALLLGDGSGCAPSLGAARAGDVRVWEQACAVWDTVRKRYKRLSTVCSTPQQLAPSVYRLSRSAAAIQALGLIEASTSLRRCGTLLSLDRWERITLKALKICFAFYTKLFHKILSTNPLCFSGFRW